jgi:hypothetical protein
MKKLAGTSLVLVVLLSLFSCRKDDSINPEDTLFKRLSRGNGIWEVESVEYRKYKTDGTYEVDSLTTPDLQYIFYVKSYIIEGVSIDINSITLARPNSLGFTYDIWAEEERVVFYTDPLYFDYVFSVKENKPNKQVWVSNGTYETSIYITLKKCPSCEPYYADGISESEM